MRHAGAGTKRDEKQLQGRYNADSEGDQQAYARALKKVQKLFADRKIKWYSAYMMVFDYDTATMKCEMLAQGAHEEIPPLEINTVAKGFVPPPQAKKTIGGLPAGLVPNFAAQAAMAEVFAENWPAPQEGNQF